MTDDDEQSLRHARGKWRYRGGERPAFAQSAEAGQESVWDYPRPPRLVSDPRLVTVTVDGVLLARTRHAVRVLETGSPPTFYIPAAHVFEAHLVPESGRSTFCEWKGNAEYFSVRTGVRVIATAAWRYPSPFPEFRAIAGFFSFYPRKVECCVDGERVQPQPGAFYGGWVTREVIGPFKGEPGTEGW